MIRSMTGFGRASASGPSCEVVVEAASVNRKQLDVAANLPRSLAQLEPALRDRVSANISRGRINLSIRVTPAASALADTSIDLEAAARVVAASRMLQEHFSLVGGLSIDTLLKAPGVLRSPEEILTPESVASTLDQAVSDALKSLNAMREQEGAILGHDLLRRLETLAQSIATIRQLAAEVPLRQRAVLLERIKQAGIELQADPDRLERELALFADRSDITEELTRLDAHISQFKSRLTTESSPGRTLDFLCQELARELNTTGVKCAHSGISALIVSSKAELERIREQVQNIE
jgi:uncharacterized protein (TIGR00255 family)